MNNSVHKIEGFKNLYYDSIFKCFFFENPDGEYYASFSSRLSETPLSLILALENKYQNLTESLISEFENDITGFSALAFKDAKLDFEWTPGGIKVSVKSENKK